MLYNGVWEKSNKDQAAESSQEAGEEGRSWREAELGPNGRSQSWNRGLQAVETVLSSSRLGSPRQGTPDCLKARERGYRKMPLRFKPQTKSRTFNLYPSSCPSDVSHFRGLDGEWLWSLKVETVFSFWVKLPPCCRVLSWAGTVYVGKTRGPLESLPLWKPTKYPCWRRIAFQSLHPWNDLAGWRPGLVGKKIFLK